jgi:hypothetical protein
MTWGRTGLQIDTLTTLQQQGIRIDKTSTGVNIIRGIRCDSGVTLAPAEAGSNYAAQQCYASDYPEFLGLHDPRTGMGNNMTV